MQSALVAQRLARIIVAALTLAACADSAAPLDGEVTDQTEEALGALEYDIAVAQFSIHDRSHAITRDWGSGYFVQDGDQLWLRDYLTDKKSVGLLWRTSNGRRGICRFKGGSNKEGVCNKNFPETATITMQLARCDAAVSGCSDWSDWRDVTPAKTFSVR